MKNSNIIFLSPVPGGVRIFRIGCVKYNHYFLKTGDASPVFLVVRLAAHVSNGLKSRIRPVVGRI